MQIIEKLESQKTKAHSSQRSAELPCCPMYNGGCFQTGRLKEFGTHQCLTDTIESGRGQIRTQLWAPPCVSRASCLCCAVSDLTLLHIFLPWLPSPSHFDGKSLILSPLKI